VPVPYLKPLPASVESWRTQIGGDNSFKIGIAWAGNDAHYPCGDPRTTRLSDWLPLADVPGISLYSLQKDRRSREIFDYPQLNVIDLSEARRDFGDLAAIMSLLDLVITVDSSPAHLAGALGCPVWTLIAYRHDWRWRRDGSTHPWYPSMRLFRQGRTQTWASVILEIKAELEKMLRDRAGQAEVQ
jgi:hypothetical protein